MSTNVSGHCHTRKASMQGKCQDRGFCENSRLIFLQALTTPGSGRSTSQSRPVHCVHLLHLPAPNVHLPAVCCKPLQPPCNSPAVSALPPDVVTDAPVAAIGCGEPRERKQPAQTVSAALLRKPLSTNPRLSKQNFRHCIV